MCCSILIRNEATNNVIIITVVNVLDSYIESIRMRVLELELELVGADRIGPERRSVSLVAAERSGADLD